MAAGMLLPVVVLGNSLSVDRITAEVQVTNPADPLDTAFLMRVEISMGDGLGVLPNGAFQLTRDPSPDAAAALERAIRAWDHFGVVHGFGPAMFRGGPGYLHGLYTDERFGPRWNGTTLRWLEDFG